MHKLTQPTDKAVQQFGYLASLILIGFGIFYWWKDASSPAIFLASGIAVLIVTRIAPQLIRPIFIASLFATFPIGWCISFLLFALVFYGLIWPMGLVRRRKKSSPFRLEREKNTKWTNHQTTTSYFRQF